VENLRKVKKIEICHVCKKEKKPYFLVMSSDIFSQIAYNQAREDGPICERCNDYYIWTHEFKDSTETEYENAKKANWFANMILEWWEKDKKMIPPDDVFGPELKENLREFGGTAYIRDWCRKTLNGE